MNLHSLLAGEVATFSQDFDRTTDPLSIYAALCVDGMREDTMLFEQSNGLALVLDRAALRIECRGSLVTLHALTANGQRLMSIVEQRTNGAVIASEEDMLCLEFERFNGPNSDERLAAPSPFDVLRVVSTCLSSDNGTERFSPLAIGIIAYDNVDLFEDLPTAKSDPIGFPDFLFFVPESLIVFEENRPPRAIITIFGPNGCSAELPATLLGDLIERCDSPVESPEPAPCSAEARAITVDLDDPAFADLVRQMKEHIASGEVYQIVISRTFSAPCARPFEAFRALRALDPSPYSFFVSGQNFQLFGASPETSVRIFKDEGLNVELKPIAGTRPRGANADEDNRFEADLRLDPKEQAEHMMLVDLARNDVARISEAGTRRVTQLMGVERYARVMHLVSSVTGKLRDGLDACHALKACLNMGTLTGAPKIRAMELIRNTETTKRGPYGGAIGWLGGDGTMDSAILIRSALVKDGTAFVRAGAGIVYDSDPMAEAEETRRKASAILSALTDCAQ
jgi:anthranilate synthase component 1